MKIPNKREFQQIVFNHSSEINCQYFINLYKNCSSKLYSYLVINTTFPLDNPSRFRESLIAGILKIIMTIDVKIKVEKLQYHINSEAAKVSPL